MMTTMKVASSSLGLSLARTIAHQHRYGGWSSNLGGPLVDSSARF
jgi:hypothetical protein